MSRRLRPAVAVAVVLALVAAVAAGIWLVQRARPFLATPPVIPRPPVAAPGFAVTALPATGPTRIPPTASTTSATATTTLRTTASGGRATTGPAPDPTTAWAQATAPRLGMSWRALRAYGRAQQSIRRSDPACGVGWSTLAGIGWIESRHGTLQGASIDADGVVRPRITGPALDGTGPLARIPSTDGGRLDGDTVWDRAVGPMQFLPQSWARYGTGNPNDIDAAAVAAAKLLCSRSDLDTAPRWRSSVLAYNRSSSYVADVWTAADWYGRTAGS